MSNFFILNHNAKRVIKSNVCSFFRLNRDFAIFIMNFYLLSNYKLISCFKLLIKRLLFSIMAPITNKSALAENTLSN